MTMISKLLLLLSIAVSSGLPKVDAFLGGYSNGSELSNRNRDSIGSWRTKISSTTPTEDPFCTNGARTKTIPFASQTGRTHGNIRAPIGARTEMITSPFALYASNKNNEDKDGDLEVEEEKEARRDVFSYMEEPRLVAVDLLAFLIVCEFIGLTDVLISSGFWKQGGFLQPVTTSSFSNMGLLIRRDSLMSICWIVSSIYNRGYSYSAIATDMGVIKSSFTIFTDYCSLLILSALAFAVAGHVPVDSLELVREAWFTILIVGGFRFAYSYGQRF